MLLSFLLLIVGFGLLVLGGNWLLKASVEFAAKVGIPKIVIGLTIVSFATSMPELIVSVNAALNDSAGISLGNVVGSNIANIGLVLGVTALITPIAIPNKFFKTDWIYLLITNAILIVVVGLDNRISRLEGIIMFSLLVIYMIRLLRIKEPVDIDAPLEDIKSYPWYKIIVLLFLGGVGLWLGSELLVKHAKIIALEFHVPESIVGLTIVAIGTSIPELAASVIAALKGEKSISLGNLIGSNIFNILSVLGITSIIQPIEVTDSRFMHHDFWWMVGFAIIILPLAIMKGKSQLDKFQGGILVFLYILYIYLIV